MGELFEISPAQRRHMQEQSAALIAANPAKYLTGPYRMPEPPPRVPRVLVAEVPVEPVVMSPPEPVDTRSALDRAADWLREALTPDPVPATQIAALAETAQVKPRTLRRAYSKIGVQCFKRSGAWWWQLPDEDGPAGRGRLPAQRRRPAVNA